MTVCVLDVGGGTADITVHDVEEVDGCIVLAEALPPVGALAGSVYVDRAFRCARGRRGHRVASVQCSGGQAHSPLHSCCFHHLVVVQAVLSCTGWGVSLRCLGCGTPSGVATSHGQVGTEAGGEGRGVRAMACKTAPVDG